MSNWIDLLDKTISPEAVEAARREEAAGGDVADYLVEKKILPFKSMLAHLSKYYNLPALDLEHYEPDEKSVSLVSEDLARRFMIVPLFEIDHTLYIATATPEDLTAHDYLSRMTGLHIDTVLTTRSPLLSSLNRIYLTKEKTERTMGAFAEQQEQETRLKEIELEVEDVDAPAIKLVNYILTQAVNLGSSDIHIEPFRDHVLLRYRIDGILHEFPPPPFHIYRALISRIKIISNLDVAERRLPQDGRSSFQLDDRRYDLRVSIIPNVHGEGVVIRILDTMGKQKDLSDIGFSQKMLNQYIRSIMTPYGILLVTGPTGSGKSTTLYATLKHILTPKKKIITLEDPVEYQLDGITQIQVNAEIGYSFATGLRSILRHDPDIIMLGEIRDLETAEIAIRSSLTGHLVFSTLHTNDSASAITRLVDMGVPPFLVFASLIAVIAQRLVRYLCPKCKAEMQIEREKLLAFGIPDIPPGTTIYKAQGCSACGNLGYRGRTAIFEFLEITEEMRRLPRDRITPEELRAIALRTGFVSLRDSAIEKLFSGVTSLEDLIAYTIGEKSTSLSIE